MTDAQTEARALLEKAGARFLEREDYDAAVAALAAKDAELAKIDTHRRKVIAENERLLNALIDRDRQLAEARKALERIEVRTRSVPSDTAEDDKRDKYRANSIARRALEEQGGENG